MPKLCPRCQKPGLRSLGAGSQRVEAALGRLVPSARVARMDSDTMLRREDYERTLAAFGKGELDVLVGTQMIAKGLDFPRVTLVGVVDADGGLHLPDFRAAERTFQLVSQVAGRAGRGGLEGRVFVQTHTPEHPAIQRALSHDYEGFVAGEEQLRAQLGYPPFGELVRALAEDADEERARGAIAEACDALNKALRPGEATVLGPAPAPISMLRGRHRWHLLVKAKSGAPALTLTRKVLVEAARKSRVRLAIDVDPLSMM